MLMSKSFNACDAIRDHHEVEFVDYLEVVAFGAKKYDNKNWLEPDGQKSSFKDMHASMFRHLAESMAGHRADKETGLDPLLHLATRALMMYTRLKRGIRHKEDSEDESKDRVAG